jgi:outer membrane lipoprotein-sorting protein
MTTLRRPNRRWIAPLIAIIGVAGISVGPGLFHADAADPKLPPLTPAELLVKARTAQLTPLSGTVELTSNLGLPDLGELGTLGGGSDTSIASLLSGTHSADVWISSAEQIRVATKAPLEETNWIRNGTDLWSYDSSTLTATHATLPAEVPDLADAGIPNPVERTPVEFAQALLDKVTPSTSVTVDSTTTVAGRAAYRLVIEPNSADSTVGQVVFAVDAATGLPLDVKVVAKASGSTAIELGFTDINFNTPDASRFEFTPPPGTTVVEATDPTQLLDAGQRRFEDGPRRVHKRDLAIDGTTPPVGTADTATPEIDVPSSGLIPGGGKVTTVGENWTTAAIITGASLPGQIDQLFGDAQRVTVGSTGGRLITTSLLTVLVLDDGRVAVGPVQPAALEALVAAAPAS